MGNLSAAMNSKKERMGSVGNEDLHLHFHLDKSLGEILEKMKISMTVNEIFVNCQTIFCFNQLDSIDCLVF